jgi:predicted nucleic acid-binding protein
MICLDTNYLILSLVPGSKESRDLVEWIETGEALITPMPAWYEFLCGPVTPAQVATMRAFLRDIVPFDEAQATLAASLFNAAKRKRSLRVDAMVAATAMVANAALATNNRSDFELFVPHGLELADAA